MEQVVTPKSGQQWMRRQFTAPKTDNVALISFTSGTEGSPKGVILSHNNLAEVVTRLNSLMQLDESISEYIGVPVYHSFGFGRCRAVATAGGRFFIPGNGFNPSEIRAMLKNREINAISAVPSLWRVLLANKDLIGNYGKRVRWIEIGSQYMSRQEKEELKALFPEARIVQHYGLTEASRTTLLEIHEAEGEALESVGQAFGSVAVKLTEEGRIAIRGEHVAQGYLIEGKETPLKDDEGWFLTKDLGSLEDGYLYYKGRADDVINCGGIKVHPETLETKIYARLGYSDGLAICRQVDPMRGEGFLVAVAKDLEVDQQQLREAVVQTIQELGVNAANAVTVIEIDSLPKTATGKIQRKQLADWYAHKFSQEDQLGDTTDATLANGSRIQTILCRTLKIHQVQPQDTFIALGGDSLSYVQLSMELERYLGYLPRNWEQMPLSELEKLVPQKRFSTTIEMNILLRALAISGVVINHSGFHFIEGGAMLLLLIAGLNFSRFQGCALIQGQLKSILPLLKHILAPYFIIAIAYQVWKQKFDPMVLFLLGDFQSTQQQIENNIFFVWFIANLVQTIILFSIPFSIQAVRNFAKASPWRFGIVSLGIGAATRILGPLLWDSSYTADQVPHMLFWLFALGWCIHFAKSRTEKVATTALILMTVPALLGFEGLQEWWTLIGSVLLLWLPYVSIPSIIKSPIQTISAASYYIYLTVLIFITLVTKLIGRDYPLITMSVTLLGGVLTWAAVQSLQQFLSDRQFRNVKNPTDTPQY
ncbi:AMP-binding protein [Cyanobacteria bacterium FACHB-63]|nr:AMP-binding protein [Cyanobacteria bacterium FACHB-63]